MSTLVSPRVVLLSGLLLSVAVGGCAIDLVDLIGGGDGGSTDAVYFSVYNFHEESVRAEVTYRDQEGVEHTRTITQEDGTSPISTLTRGSLSILVDDLTTTADDLVTVTFTFPEDGNAVVTVNIRRAWIPDNYRVRMGVLGPDADSVGWFVDG